MSSLSKFGMTRHSIIHKLACMGLRHVHWQLANGAQLEARANQVRFASTIASALASALVIFTLKMIA